MISIDIAQIITTILGFLLVVWILAKYAWGPILTLLDQRREKIRKDFADAEKALADADKLKADFEAKLADIKTIERERVQEAVKRGEGVASGIVAEARAKAEATLAKAAADIEIEAQKAQLELRAKVVEMTIAATEKVIREHLLDDERHRKLIGDYVASLGETGRA